MSRYDEDKVIELLRGAVPPVPDASRDRVLAVKHRAGRQRAAIWTQTLGAAASVLLVVGVAAAVAGPGGTRRVEPTDEPIKALAASLENVRSLRFEAELDLLEEPKRPPGSRLSPEQVRQAVESRVTGAATRDGDFQVDGDASIMTAAFGLVFADEDDPHDADVHFRLVNGTSYRSGLDDMEELPPGKKWVRQDEGASVGLNDVRRGLRMLSALAEDVRYVGDTEVRGVPVAEYRLTIPDDVTETGAYHVHFALDAENRLRRVSSEFSLTELVEGAFGIEEEEGYAITTPATPAQPSPTATDDVDEPTPEPPPPAMMNPSRPDFGPLPVRVQVEVFGYGEDVGIEAPPAGEVIDSDELYEELEAEPDSAMSKCMEAANGDEEKSRACFEQGGYPDGPGTSPGEPECTKNPDGSEHCTFSSEMGSGSGGWTEYGPSDSPPPTSDPRPPAATASPAP